MNAKTKVTISFESLPEKSNHHELTVALESRINDAVALAINDAFESAGSEVVFSIQVPEIRLAQQSYER